MRALTACVLVLALSTSAARAESPLERDARIKYQNGQKLFDAARYEDALAQYTASWELTHYPAILYRIALCQDLLARREEAIAGYEKYLAAEPASERREAVESRLRELRSTLTLPVPGAHPPPAAPEVRAPEVPAPPALATPSLALTAPPPPAPHVRRSPTRTWWFWTALVVGAGAVAAAIAVPIATHYFSEDPFVGTLGSRKAN